MSQLSYLYYPAARSNTGVTPTKWQIGPSPKNLTSS